MYTYFYYILYLWKMNKLQYNFSHLSSSKPKRKTDTYKKIIIRYRIIWIGDEHKFNLYNVNHTYI